MRCVGVLAVCGLMFAAIAPPPAEAQARARPRWEVPGFDFHPSGVHRRRGRAVREGRAAVRRAALARIAPGVLAAGPYGPGGAWVGTYAVPVLLGRPIAVDTSFLGPALVQDRLFGTGLGRLSLRDYYLQQSRGMLAVTGATVGWFALPGDTAYYAGTQGCGGGIICPDPTAHLRDFIFDLLTAADSVVDFAQYDNDGPDGVPNTADDDGYVDLVALLHPQIGGECQGPNVSLRHLWSHRGQVAGWGAGDYVTGDASASPAAPTGAVVVRDYVLTGADGAGDFGCAPGSVLQIGILAHELGHGLGLPDLYDVGGPTQGIGEWGLMGAGNYRFAHSPAFLEGWSRAELGWVTEVTIDRDTAVVLTPVETHDSVLIVPAGDAGEYFLLENRQRLASDAYLHEPGLTIYHVNPSLIASRRPINRVNSGTLHGLTLLEADGLRQLWCGAAGCNRGDAGDPYPGVSGNRRLSFDTDPAASSADGRFAGVVVESVLPTGEDVALRVRFGGISVVRASDTATVVQVDGWPYSVYRAVFEEGAPHTVGVADTQFTQGQRVRWRFRSWSDGGARIHAIAGVAAGDTIEALLAPEYMLSIDPTTGGSVSASRPLATNGTYIPADSAVTLTPTPWAGFVFGGWTGDTITTDPVLTLPMGRSYHVRACFEAPLAITSASQRRAGRVAALYADTLVATGGTCSGKVWELVEGDLPAGFSLSWTGELTGWPEAPGTFTYSARIVSGARAVTGEFTFSIVTPVLDTRVVVSHLLTGTGLSPADVSYLDWLGNRDRFFDVGDFKAWVDLTGAPLDAAAAAILPGLRQ